LRQLILRYDDKISERGNIKCPFFCYKGKMFCYVWLDKKTHQPGRNIDHPSPIKGERSRMKIPMLNPNKDLPVKTIDAIFKKAMLFYR
jgi:hypothetical protein